MGLARLRLASLWISQGARVMADNCLRLFVALHLANLGLVGDSRAGWFLVTLILMAPAVLLAPLNGALGNSLPKPLVLIGSAAFALTVVAGFQLLHGPWLVGWTLVAISSAVYGPVRSALLPAASLDTRWPLTRINGLFELGVATAILGGLILGAGQGPSTNLFHGSLALFSPPVMAICLHAVALLAAIPVRFPSDVSRPESPARAIAGFFRDTAQIWKAKEVRGCLLGLSLLRGVMTAVMGAVLAGLGGGGLTVPEWIQIAVWLSCGVALGSLLVSLQRHPRRALGLVPWGATGLTIGLIVAASATVPGWILCLFLGATVGLINVPLAAAYQANLPPDARGNGMAVRNFADYVMIAIFCGVLLAAERAGFSSAGLFWLLAIITGLAGVVSWVWLRREVVEQLLEFLLAPLYRIRGHGPGLDQFPMRGPALVIANHSAWLDPLWLGKVLPRRLIPMMTSVFFDLPGMRWAMVYLAEAIRVQASTYRRDVPEIAQAIAVLDRGDVVVVFPEGSMRKREEKALRQFGQGVWHILHERPDTPVYACWIEGGWGSFFSYWKGAPTKNKKIDFWRRIDVAVGPGERLDPVLLQDQRATRTHLMQKCADTRRILGLEAPVVDAGFSAEDESETT